MRTRYADPGAGSGCRRSRAHGTCVTICCTYASGRTSSRRQQLRSLVRAADRACDDSALLDQWHPVAAVEELIGRNLYRTDLLGNRIEYAFRSGEAEAWMSTIPAGMPSEPLPALTRYGYLWVSLGEPPSELFSIPEYDEPDRLNVHSTSIGVAVSAPRAVENFFDMAHFPFVHRGILGAEPHTEVRDYDVDVDLATNDLYARDCVFSQPKAMAASSRGSFVRSGSLDNKSHTNGDDLNLGDEVEIVHYTYRISHPHCVMLYKESRTDQTRTDVIALFLQATSAETVRAHILLSLIDDEGSVGSIRRFNQHIFGQDKPILENHRPKRLPLDPRAETPIRADRLSIAYRRWLSQLGVSYTTIPAC